MKISDINDPILSLLANVHSHLGSVGLAIVLCLLYAGMSSLIALTERNSPGYRNAWNVPYFNNFSTLIDFSLLDPILIVLMLRSTAYMVSLPSLLGPVVELKSISMASKTTKYYNLICSGTPCLILAIVAGLAWVVYAYSLWIGRTKLTKKKIFSKSRNGIYVGLMTMLLIYLILTYFFRAIVASIYVLDVTKSGFLLKKSAWEFGARVVGRFQSYFGLTAGVLALIIVVFIAQDMLLYKKARRRMRVIAASLFLTTTTAFVFLGSLIGVHDSMMSVLDKSMIDLAKTIRSHFKADDLKRLALLGGFPIWTLHFGEVIAFVIGQTIAVIATLVSDQALSVVRKGFRAKEA